MPLKALKATVEAVKSLPSMFSDARTAILNEELSQSRPNRLAEARVGTAICGALLVAAGASSIGWTAESAADLAADIRNARDHTVETGTVDVVGVLFAPVTLPLGAIAMYGGAGFASLAGAMERRRQQELAQ